MPIELAKAYVQIVPSARGIKGALSDALGEETQGLGEKAGADIGGKLAGALKTALGAAAIGKVIMDSVNAGGALQQSLGGIETLFKNSADTVKAYASQAYRTAGLSANEYMEAVTGFSATLLDGLGGDTEAAARIADKALVQMSDNANKMGTDMASIQQAYQGFAKDNYTMLDNLRLGYGGTQAEMARLINESGVLGDTMQVTANTVNDVPFDKIIEAIGVVQDELGITGTTAAEAATTLTGSFASMRAAFQDLMGNMALGEQLAPSLAALVETVRVYLVDNLIPLAINAVSGLLQSLAALIPAFIAEGTELIRSLASGISAGVPELLAQALPALLAFCQNLRANFGELVDAGIDLVLNLLDGIIAALPDLWAYVPQIVTNIAGLINDNAPKLLAGGVQLVLKLAEGLLKSIPQIVKNAGSIVEAIFSVLSAVNWISLGASLIQGIANGIKSMAGSLLEAVKGGFASALDWIRGLPKQAVQWGKDICKSIVAGISGQSATQVAVSAAKVAATAATATAAAQTGGASSGGWGLDDSIADKAEVNALRVQNLVKTTAQTASTWAAAASSASTAAAAKSTAATASAAQAAQKAAATVVSTLKTSNSTLLDGVQTLTETTRDTLSDGSEQVRQVITETADQAIDGALMTVETVRTIAADGSETVAKTVKESASADFDGLWRQLQTQAGNGVLGTFGTLWTAVQGQDWLGVGKWVAATIYNGLDADKQAAIQAWGSGLLQQMNDVLGSLTEQLSAGAWALGEKIVSGITGGFGGIVSETTALGDTLKATFEGLKGPLSAAAQAISSGMSGGLLSSIPAILSGFAGMIGSIGAAVGGMLSAVSAALSATIFGVPAGAVVAAAAVALGVAIAAIIAKLGGSSKSSAASSSKGSTSSANTSSANVSSAVAGQKNTAASATADSVTHVGNAVFDTGALLWDYEKDAAQPLRSSQRPTVEVNQYIYSKAQTAADLLREARYEQERAVLQGV